MWQEGPAQLPDGQVLGGRPFPIFQCAVHLADAAGGAIASVPPALVSARVAALLLRP